MNMKVKILINVSGFDFSYFSGQIVEVSKGNAENWIAAGIAEEIKDDEENKPDKKVKSVK